MKEYLLEEAVRQNWETKFKLYESGIGAIENINQSNNKVTRVYLNVKNTNKFINNYLNKKSYKIVPTNKLTNLLIKLGLVKITIEEDDLDEDDLDEDKRERSYPLTIGGRV